MRFLGNKTRMLSNIDSFIKKHKITGKIFCDLFTGSASVADHYKDKYQIIANDMLESSVTIARAKIENGTMPEFDNFKKEKEVDIFTYLNELYYQPNERSFIYNNYSPKGGRQFFTEEVAIKIDGIRQEIENLKQLNIINDKEYSYLLASLLESTMGVSNTTGTYEAFLKEWDRRSFKEFRIEPITMEIKKLYSNNNIVYNKDSNQLIKEIQGDILYLDTPYTITDYQSAYHLLETIVKYDNPEIKGITGRRVNKPSKSKYTIQKEALDAYEDLIKSAKFKNIIISYSTQSLIKEDDLVDMLKKYAKNQKVTVDYFQYREYRNIRSSQKENKLAEILIHIEKEIDEDNDLNIIKSPLNYSGSKNYIVDQIIENIPKDIDTFVDAMGGAFNVGINIETDKVIYNEFNNYVYEIIDMLLKEDKEQIIKEVKKIILENNLEKANKETYIEYRKKYNANKTTMGLFILQMYCFQNQLRFNSKHEFNTPVGNCACNETTFERIRTFIPKAKQYETSNLDYKNIDLNKFDSNTLIYFDPPYIITNATYNDGKRGFKGWDKEQERELLDFLNSINDKGIKFMLSNVINHNGKTNTMLKEWIEKNGFRIITLKPHSGRYGTREEILVVNY